MIDIEVIDAFHMMWGTFPAPVRLIHKSRKVLAVNEIAQSIGMETDVHCYSVGDPESHKGCKANEALSTSEGQRMDVDSGTKIKFWSPVRGCSDVFVHFSIPVASQK